MKASNEKEDILARVISDLESKNRHLQEALSHMSSEFQVCPLLTVTNITALEITCGYCSDRIVKVSK